MLEKSRLWLYDQVLSYAVRRNNPKLFAAMYEKFPKTARLYKEKMEKEETELAKIPDISEEMSKKLWDNICSEIENKRP